MKIGFIGLGHLGSAMAEHLMKAGHDAHGIQPHTRS
jgi:3-hydroxyisobutyrate dehydrogenase-like beta-hydroxyacid dehydrogenase